MIDDGYYIDRGNYLGCPNVEYMLIENGNQDYALNFSASCPPPRPSDPNPS